MHLQLPISLEQRESLHAGQVVYLSGKVLTARDAAHKRLVATINSGESLPISLQDQTIYYVGPCPAPNDHVIGAAGPTTSVRMDSFTPILLAQGLQGMIGKGPRTAEVIKAIAQYNAVYFIACGGAGALLAQCIKEVEIVAYEDLGTEAIRQLEVKDFPVIVAIDSKGNNIFSNCK